MLMSRRVNIDFNYMLNLEIRVQNNQTNEFICNGTATEISWELVDGSEDLPYQITVRNGGNIR